MLNHFIADGRIGSTICPTVHQEERSLSPGASQGPIAQAHIHACHEELMNDTMKHDEFPPNEMLAHVSPFHEPHSLGEHFVGAGHLNILVGIRRDIAERVPLIILTGEEGCGKSVLGQMVAAEASSGLVTVLLDQGIDSFEEMVGRIGASLDVVLAEDAENGVADLVEQIAVCVAVKNIRLLVVCDGAEGMYLATLERLRKMMDRLNKVVVSMQLLLIGRVGLLENLRQLSICNFEEIEESRYSLAPLNQAETRSYIDFCRQRMGEAERAIFTPENADRIYQESGGNFRRIHHFGEQLCNRYNKDASFWVLLENVEGGIGRSNAYVDQAKLLWQRFDPHRLPKKYLYFGGAIAAAALALVLALAGEDERPGPVEPETEVAVQQAAPEDDEEIFEQAVVDGPDTATVADQAADEQVASVVLQDSDAALPSEKEEGPLPGGDSQGLSIKSPTQLPVELPQAPEMLPAGEAIAEVTKSSAVEELDPARAQLREADVLLAEAQEAVEAAMRQQGKELVTAPQAQLLIVDKQQMDNRPGIGNGGVTEIVVQPAKVIAQGQQATRADAAPLFHPDRVKKLKEPEDIDAPVLKATVRREGDDVIAGEQRVPGQQGKVLLLQRDTLRDKLVKGRQGDTAAPASGGDGTGSSPDAAEVMPPATRESQPQGETLAGTAPKKIPVLAKVIVPGKSKSGGNSIYPARLAASSSWLAGVKDGKYTMQLMALTSTDARENVQATLARPSYVSQADNLYILEKEDRSTVYVFLGEYDSLADARAARQTIPADLQQYAPYVLSIQEAVQKVR